MRLRVTDRAELLNMLARRVASASAGLPLAARLAAACRDILEVSGLSITIEAATPNRVTLAVTDQVSAELERLQDVLQQGPCWDAYVTGEPQRTNLSEADDARWPEFCSAARTAVGLRTVFGLPMQLERNVVGVISVHQPEADLVLSGGLEAALFLADAVGAALLLDPQQHDPHGRAGPWSNRAEIHQATGMVIAQLHVSADDALAILRAHAYAHDTALDDIAEQVIDRRLNFEKDQP